MSLRNKICSFCRPDPEVFEQLTNTSSIHGVKYIGDSKSPKTTKTFWIVAFFCSILGCAYYANQVFEKWYVTPDIGRKVHLKSIRTVPFPAVTICPQTKIKRSILNYQKALVSAFSPPFNPPNTTDEENERKFFEMALQICTPAHVNNINDNNPDYTNYSYLNGHDFVRTMSELSLSINETIIGMKYPRGFLNKNFEVLIDRVMTSEGFCVTYNLQDYDRLFKSGLSEDFDSYKNNRTSSWNPFDGYPYEDIEQYPLRVLFGKFTKRNIFLLAQSEDDLDESCLGPEQGHKIFLHMPNEIPSFMHNPLILSHSWSKTLFMKATQFRTSDDLQRYSVAQRRCYFDHENFLRFFKSYTKLHCDMECLTNQTLQKCGCVKFFMPRDKNTPVCDLKKLACAENFIDYWLEEDEGYRSNTMPCNCYPSCSEIKYDVVRSKDSPFSDSKTLSSFNDDKEFQKDFPNGKISRLVIEFEDYLIEVQENYLGYKIQHFISDCGGLLGLFMGCSILSLVEIFYQVFSTLLFPKRQTLEKENEEKVQTSLEDARAIVLVEDLEKLLKGLKARYVESSNSSPHVTETNLQI